MVKHDQPTAPARIETCDLAAACVSRPKQLDHLILSSIRILVSLKAAKWRVEPNRSGIRTGLLQCFQRSHFAIVEKLCSDPATTPLLPRCLPNPATLGRVAFNRAHRLTLATIPGPPEKPKPLFARNWTFRLLSAAQTPSRHKLSTNQRT